MKKNLILPFLFLLVFASNLYSVNGLIGKYYDKQDYTSYKYSKVDSTINFDWGNGSPSSLNANTFSIIWSGYIYIPETANYTFYVAHDDFMSVTIDGTQYYSNRNWTGGSNNFKTFSINNMAAGYYPIEIDYYEGTGGAYAKFGWKNNASITSQTIVPSSNLFTSVPNLSPPVVSDASMSVDENSAAGTIVGAVSATNSPTSFTITGGTGQSLFNINASGQISVQNGAVLDYETTPSYTLFVRATNAMGDSNIATITINLNNILPPSINTGQNYSVSSGSLNGTIIGTVYTSNGMATNFTINDSNFTIDNTGVITIANSTAFENGGAVYMPTVTASNAEGSDSKTITVSVDTNLDFTCANPRPFAPVYSNNIYGKLLVIGNTSLCQDDGHGGCSDPGTANNNGINMRNNDYDNGRTTDSSATTVNSSAALLTIPAGKKILWAGLFWQGYMVNWTSTQKQQGHKIKYKFDTDTSYQTNNNAQMNWVYFDSSRMYYESFIDITNYVNSHGSGYYWVGDIATSTGQPTGGSFGAWSIAVVYQDDNEAFKNITVYDGYQAIASQTDINNAINYANNNSCDASNTGVGNGVSSTLSGFLTPTSGTVHSSLVTFAGEGDVSLTGDTGSITDGNGVAHQLSNAVNPANNIMNSTISVDGVTVTTGLPYYSPNSLGADIDTFDTSGIMSNQQNSTDITFSSSGDGYMPGMYGISTELYKPDVCYEEQATYKGAPISATNTPYLDDNITYEVSITNKNYEAAKGVSIQKIFSKDSGLEYVPESMNIAPIPGTNYSSNNLTDAAGDDNATFATDTNTSTYYLGAGAAPGNGGEIKFAEITKFKYLSKVADTNVSENVYLLTYKNEQLGITYTGVQTRKCSDFNNAFSAYAPAGVFNVVNSNFSGSSDPIDNRDSNNALYTQIVGQGFTVKVLALDTDKVTLQTYTGDLNISLINSPDYTLCADDTCKQHQCDDQSTIPGTTQAVNFTDQSSKILNVTGTFASKNLAFKIAYNDINTGAVKYVCSRDSFSIRPKSYSLVLNAANPLVGGRNYILNITANSSSGSSVTDYNQTINNTSDLNASLDLIVPPGCGLSTDHIALTPNIAFSSGQATFSPLTFGNVGDVNLSIYDNNWTKIDQGASNGKLFDDCLPGSSTSTPINGKVGCMISEVKQLTFLPKNFVNTVNIQNFNSSNFTYLSNDKNMSADISLNITAVLDDNTTATNYTANCYSQDVNFTISLVNDPTIWLNGQPDAKNRIRYYDDGINTIFDNNNTVGSAEFNVTKSKFSSGIASNLGIKFNLTRSAALPNEPFIMSKNDFNISVEDTNNTIGNDFNRTTDQNVTFYYGRVHAPDYSGVSPIPAKIYYEVYCKDCNKTLYDINGSESVDSINWYLNPGHAGNIFGDVSANGANSFQAVGTTISSPNKSNAGSVTNGEETISLSSTTVPYSDKIKMYANPWLIFNIANAAANENDFIVKFYKSGSWSGQGNIGKTVDLNISNVQNNRINW